MDNDNLNYQQEQEQEQQPQQRYPQYERRRKKRRGALDWLKIGRRVFQIARLALNPTSIYIGIGILIFLMIYGTFFSPGGGLLGLTPTEFTPNNPPTVPVLPGITINVTSRGANGGQINAVANQEPIIYEVTVSYNESQLSYPVDQLMVYVPIPTNTTLVSNSYPSDECNHEVGIITGQSASPIPRIECSISALAFSRGNPFTFNVTVQPTAAADNSYIVNTVRVRLINGGVVGGVQTSWKDCVDNITKPTNSPICSFTKENLYSLLKEIDSQNANYWFYKIIPCESGFDPNLNRKYSEEFNSVGLFQFLDRPTRPEPILSWQEQVVKAVDYNKNILKGNFSYWSCSK